MAEDRIIQKLVEMEERIVSRLKTEIKDELHEEIHELRDEMNTRFDYVYGVLERLDQERLFTFHAVQRLEADLEKQQKEINTIKANLHIK